MSLSNALGKILTVIGLLAGIWLGVKYLFPVLLPFLVGLAVALAAEPAVGFGVKRLGFSRGVAAGVGVSLTLALLTGILSVVGALTVKELGSLASALPDVQKTVEQGMFLLEDWLVGMAEKMPEGARNLATGTVLELFDGGGLLLDQVTSRAPGMIGSLLGWIPDGALGLGTGLLAGFMISARLPRLRQGLAKWLPESWKETYLPAIKRMRHTLWSWLKAQGKLACVTYVIVTAGFLLLGVRLAPLWAALVALVDAVPVLGTGTVLIPWAAVSLLQGQTLRGIGLLLTYGAAMVTRMILEPRLVGKHLGLDPLVTLLAMYAGYRFWGIPGMLLAPMAATAVKTLTAQP